MATPVQSGAQSATWFLANSVSTLGAAIVDGVNTDWSALPSGKLKDLLNHNYVATETKTGFQLFLEAFAAAGGSVNVAGTVACTYYWSISGEGDGFPVLHFTSDLTDAYIVRIQASYSASE